MSPHPRTIGPYDILEVLGQGATGVVYRARHRVLGRECALKVLATDARGSRRKEIAARFVREARALASVEHPGIVRIHDVAEVDGEVYLAMEIVRGTTLAEYLRARRALPAAEALAIVEKVARALHAMHEKGLVHRDVKPNNIVLSASGEPKLIDFGIVKERGDPGAPEAPLTRDGSLLGTPAYLAPEQALGDVAATNARTDVWALGVVLYELLSGRLPFQHDVLVGLLDMIVRAPVGTPVTPEGFSTGAAGALAVRALSKDSANRPTALELAEECARLQPSSSEGGLAPSSVALVVVALAALTTLGVVLGVALARRAPLGPIGSSPPPGPVTSRSLPPPPPPPPPPAVVTPKAETSDLPAVAAGFKQSRRARLTAVLGSYAWRASEALYAVAPISTWGVAVGGRAVPVTIFDATTGEDVRVLGPRTGTTECLAATADGTRVLAGGRDEHVRLLDVATGRILATFSGHKGPVRSVAIAPSGESGASGGEDGTIRLWDLVKGTPAGVLEGHKGTVTALVYMPSGTLVSTGDDGTVRTWDASDRKDPSVIMTGVPESALAVEPGGGCIMLGQERQVVFEDIDDLSGHATHTLREQRATILAAAFAPRGKWAVSGGDDGSLALWNTERFTFAKRVDAHRGGVSAVAFAPDGKTLYSVGRDGLIRSWSFPALEPRPLTGGTGFVSAVSATGDAERIFAANLDGTLTLWDVKTHQRVKAVKLPNPVTSGAITEDGRFAAVATAGDLVFWRPDREGDAGLETRAVPGRSRAVGVGYAGGRPCALVGTRDGKLQVWDFAGTAPVRTLSTGAVTELAASRGAPRAVTAGLGPEVRVWDLDAGRCLAKLQTVAANVHALALSAHAQVVMTGNIDGTLEVWGGEVDQGKPRASIRFRRQPVVAVSSDGRHAVAGARNHQLRVWDLDSNDRPDVLDLGTSDDSVTAATFLPGDKAFAIGTRRGVVLVFELVADAR